MHRRKAGRGGFWHACQLRPRPNWQKASPAGRRSTFQKAQRKKKDAPDPTPTDQILHADAPSSLLPCHARFSAPKQEKGRGETKATHSSGPRAHPIHRPIGARLSCPPPHPRVRPGWVRPRPCRRGRGIPSVTPAASTGSRALPHLAYTPSVLPAPTNLTHNVPACGTGDRCPHQQWDKSGRVCGNE